MHGNISKSVFDFLSEIAQNNNREWFAIHKANYYTQHELVCAFADRLILEMHKHDEIETPSGKKACFRIYRDVRFSKDKAPFKTNMGIHLTRATLLRRGSYYINIEPGNCFIGGGFWGPEPADLKRIREHISADAAPLRAVLQSSTFKQVFESLKGEQVISAPKGYAKDHPNIDLLKYKQFLISKPFKDEELQRADFLKIAVETLAAMRPFLDCMTEMLTTDLNGVSLYE